MEMSILWGRWEAWDDSGYAAWLPCAAEQSLHQRVPGLHAQGPEVEDFIGSGFKMELSFVI